MLLFDLIGHNPHITAFFVNIDIDRPYTPTLSQNIYSNYLLNIKAIVYNVHSMYKWSQLWQMDFNVIKCYIISFTRSKNPILFDYTMNGVPLQRVDEIRDLGVIITSSLSWNNHIDNIISKAARISGLIKRRLGWHASSQTKYICTVH